MAEMWTRSPIMQGNTEQHQLTLISQLCGSITPEVRAKARAGRREVVMWAMAGIRHPWVSSLLCMLGAACSQCWSVAGRLGKLLQVLFASWELGALCFPCVSYS